MKKMTLQGGVLVLLVVLNVLLLAAHRHLQVHHLLQTVQVVLLLAKVVVTHHAHLRAKVHQKRHPVQAVLPLARVVVTHRVHLHAKANQKRQLVRVATIVVVPDVPQRVLHLVTEAIVQEDALVPVQVRAGAFALLPAVALVQEDAMTPVQEHAKVIVA